MKLESDADAIKAIITHPKVWRRVSADGTEPSDYEPLFHETIYYLRDAGKLASFRPLTNITWDCHITAIPGEIGIDQFAIDAANWMFTNTPAQKLFAMPGVYNWHARALARRIGFVDEGRIAKAVLWNGQIYDMFILGMTKWQEQYYRR